MCVYAYACADTCIYVHMEARGGHPIFYHSLTYLSEVGTGTGPGPRLEALAQISVTFTNMQRHAQVFVAWVLGLGSHSCTANTLKHYTSVLAVCLEETPQITLLTSKEI